MLYPHGTVTTNTYVGLSVYLCYKGTYLPINCLLNFLSSHSAYVRSILFFRLCLTHSGTIITQSAKPPIRYLPPSLSRSLSFFLSFSFTFFMSMFLSMRVQSLCYHLLDFLKCVTIWRKRIFFWSETTSTNNEMSKWDFGLFLG